MLCNIARTKKTGPATLITQSYTHILSTEKSAFFIILKFPPKTETVLCSVRKNLSVALTVIHTVCYLSTPFVMNFFVY